ncbi:substrate-binding domain-containing protein [Rhodospira trueperi]|uniref:Molybdate transport system substrate-binding protein n=1 Tax=Rhodospira trueperi TaxID=69960 RepID=A0A1G7D7B7_9PROT|nr:substrate-binding domain-containing protein [Rhodospira trueperi]SDE47462.1 molybdate transport system substrate-binding protein [Rhodospira trueperi]
MFRLMRDVRRSRCGTHQARPWLLVLLLVSMGLALAGCDDDVDQAARTSDANLLIYCGITMLHPIRAVAAVFEAETGATVTISQGGSEDLYKSLKANRLGDLYFPGSLSYRTRNLEEGLLGEAFELGYNVSALLVLEGNPKRIPADLAALADPALSVVIANPQSGSIGRETQRVLEAAGLNRDVLANTSFMATDSRNLNQFLLDGAADLIMNWRATAFFPENRDQLDVLDIDPALAEPKILAINLLTFSAHPELAHRFMGLAASERGQAIFRSFGFLDRDGRVGVAN